LRLNFHIIFRFSLSLLFLLGFLSRLRFHFISFGESQTERKAFKIKMVSEMLEREANGGNTAAAAAAA